MLDRDAFEERAAIAEFDGGLSRFQAETLAAQAQGLTRWQAIEEIRNADSKRNPARQPDHGEANARHGSDDLSGVQRGAAQQQRPLSERVVSAGWCGLALLALLMEGRGIL